MIEAGKVHETLRRHQLVDGFPIVADLDRSHGVWLHDAVTGQEYLDAYTSFASWPIGYNHPMMKDPAFVGDLVRAASTKLANADLYTREMAGFVDAFAGRVTPAGYTHHFWVSGGALAVENALKAAFDYKARRLGRTDFADNVNDLVILHFQRAFHGRTGYTMSLTNTLPDKVGLYPKFDWPRVPAPEIEFDIDGNIANDIEALERACCSAIEAALDAHRGTVAAIIIEPIQCEGGDRYFRPEFFEALRRYADDQDALLIFDEVQTGFFGTGKAWYWQHAGIKPDIVAFGKKTQVCGVYANSRIDEIPDNVFRRSSRINSTWGGNLVDMVRCRRFIEIIEKENLATNTTAMGERAVQGLRRIAGETGAIRNVRGIGSLVAFTAESPSARDAIIKAMFDQRLLALTCGPDSVRLRLPLVIDADEVDQILDRTRASVCAVGVA